MDRHLNLFYSYKTAHIEDNVTRAFIITLQSLSPIHIRMFIDSVILSKLHAGQPLRGKRLDFLKANDSDDFAFDLQPTKPASGPEEEELLTGENGLLVGITYSGEQSPEGTGTKEALAEGDSRPDALVADKINEMELIFESKLSDTLRAEQLKRHFNNFFDPERTSLSQVHVEISWQQIADFFEKVTRTIPASSLPCSGERHLIHQFITYLDTLGLLQFQPFAEVDFMTRNYQKLHKLIKVLSGSSRHLNDFKNHEVKAPRENKEATGRQLSFPQLENENFWIDFSDDEQGESNIHCGIVCGCGKKSRATQLRKYIQASSNDFSDILRELQQQLPPQLALVLGLHGWFYLSRFRTVSLGNITPNSPYKYPENYEEFCKALDSSELNTFSTRLSKDDINHTFTQSIKDNARRNHIKLDQNGHFPHWEETEYRQYCYIHIDVVIPKSLIVGAERGKLTQTFLQVFKALMVSANKLQKDLDKF